MATHTAGPWTYVRNPENTRFIIDSEPHHAIATTAGYGCDDEDVARLIAAAPDLLAACEAFADYDAGDETDGVGLMLAYDTAITAVRAAIAKAKGE